MPISYRIDPAEKVIHTTLDGEVTDRDFIQHAIEITSDPEIHGSFVELIQHESTSMKGVSVSGVRQTADALNASNAVSKIAIVASRGVEFGLARMVELLAHESQIEIQVFQEQADARSWLEIK